MIEYILVPIICVALGCVITHIYHIRREGLIQKRDVTKRLLRTSYYLTSEFAENMDLQDYLGDPYQALNEARIVFQDHPEIINLLEQLVKSKKQSEVIAEIIVKMAIASKMPNAKNLEEKDLKEPFIPKIKDC